MINLKKSDCDAFRPLHDNSQLSKNVFGEKKINLPITCKVQHCIAWRAAKYTLKSLKHYIPPHQRLLHVSHSISAWIDIFHYS